MSPSLLDKIEQRACKVLDKSDIRTKDLVDFLRTIELTPSEIQALKYPDTLHPYGRKVLYNHPRLEVMVATWTRGVSCAPHDHHDSRSAIRVLQGRSHHRMFKCIEGELVEILSERKEAGDILLCPRRQIHAMGDDDAEDVLVTLHAYAGSIDDMVVYSDTETLIVSGDCGAWVPEVESNIFGRSLGHVPRDEVIYSAGT